MTSTTTTTTTNIPHHPPAPLNGINELSSLFTKVEKNEFWDIAYNEWFFRIEVNQDTHASPEEKYILSIMYDQVWDEVEQHMWMYCEVNECDVSLDLDDDEPFRSRFATLPEAEAYLVKYFGDTDDDAK